MSVITERRDMGLYEVPCLCLCWVWDRNYVIRLPYVWYYIVVKSSFKHARKEYASKRAYVL